MYLKLRHVAIATCIHILAMLIVLVGGLAIWTEYDLLLRRPMHFFGPGSLNIIFATVFVALGLPTYSVAAWLSISKLQTSDLFLHFSAVGVLYLYAVVSLGAISHFLRKQESRVEI